MKPPSTPRTRTPLGKLRPWILPIAFLVTLFFVMSRPFDPEALHEELADGHIEDALERLSTTPREQLPPDLAAVRWWPREARELRLRTLREQVAEEPDESFDYPTIVSPLDAWRHPPAEFQLREPAEKVLILDIENMDLGLPVASLPIPVGTQTLRSPVSWIPGTAFAMWLREADSGVVQAIARFELLPGPRSEALGRALRTAHDLAPDGPAAELLTALAALHYGLHAAALERLETVLEESEPDSETAAVARELRAIVWAEQGLDLTALASLDD